MLLGTEEVRDVPEAPRCPCINLFVANPIAEKFFASSGTVHTHCANCLHMVSHLDGIDNYAVS